MRPPSQANLNFSFQKLGSVTFLTLSCKTLWKKIEKTDDPEILHCRRMEKRTKPNLWDTPARVGVQLVFAPRRQYGISVAAWWYILVRLWVELFVSQVIQAETTVSRKS